MEYWQSEEGTRSSDRRSGKKSIIHRHLAATRSAPINCRHHTNSLSFTLFLVASSQSFPKPKKNCNGFTSGAHGTRVLRLLPDSVAIREPAQHTSPDLLRINHESCCAQTDLPRHEPSDHSLRVLAGSGPYLLAVVRNQQELFAGRSSLVHTADGLQRALCCIRPHDGHGDEALGHCTRC